MPKSPVTINVVDVAGDLALTQGAIEAYQARHPELVSKVTFSKAPAPELPAKLKAMQAAGRTDIDLVTGVGAPQRASTRVWVKVLPDYASFQTCSMPFLVARKMNASCANQALVVTFMPAGPLLVQPGVREAGPDTPQECWRGALTEPLGWCAARELGSGHHLHHGAAYHLGDADPR
jgi:putative spermidine/putrescine transport system substrate-binding protein